MQGVFLHLVVCFKVQMRCPDAACGRIRHGGWETPHKRRENKRGGEGRGEERKEEERRGRKELELG